MKRAERKGQTSRETRGEIAKLRRQAKAPFEM